jgi:chloramphenicol 3-O-phosphotransferase
MWQRLTEPDLLIYLDVDYPNSRIRSPHIDGGPERLAEQHVRLAHALSHCDLYIDTSDLTPTQVAAKTREFLSTLQR